MKNSAIVALVFAICLTGWTMALGDVINLDDTWTDDSFFADAEAVIVNNNATLTIDGNMNVNNKKLSTLTLGETTAAPDPVGEGTGTLEMIGTSAMTVDALVLGQDYAGTLNLATGTLLSIKNGITFNSGTVINEGAQLWIEPSEVTWSDTNTIIFQGAGTINFGTNATGAKLELKDGTITTSGALNASNYTLSGGTLQVAGALTYGGQLTAGSTTIDLLEGASWTTAQDQGAGTISVTGATWTLGADQDFKTGGGSFSMADSGIVFLNGNDLTLDNASNVTGSKFASTDQSVISTVSWSNGTLTSDGSVFYPYNYYYNSVGISLKNDAVLDLVDSEGEGGVSEAVAALSLTGNTTVTGTDSNLRVWGEATITTTSGINTANLHFYNSGSTSTLINSTATFQGETLLGYAQSNTIENGIFEGEVIVEGAGATEIIGGTFNGDVSITSSGTTEISGGDFNGVLSFEEKAAGTTTVSGGVFAQTLQFVGAGTTTLSGGTIDSVEMLEAATGTMTLGNDVTIAGAAGVTLEGGTFNLASGKTLTLTGGDLLLQSTSGTGGGTLTGLGTLDGNVIMTAGRLAGNVTIDGNVTQSGGLIAPGNSIGEINITGDLDLVDAEIEVGENGVSDTIVVGGQTNLTSGGTMTLKPLSETINYAVGNQYIVVQSPNGISDAGYSVVSGIGGFDASGAIVNTNYVVTLERGIHDFPSGAHNANHLVNYLYDLTAAGDHQQAVMAAIQSDANQQIAAEKLSGESHMTAMQASMNSGIIRLHTLTEQIRPGLNSRYFAGDWADNNQEMMARGQFDPHAEFEHVSVWYAGYGMGGHIVGNDNNASSIVSFSGLMVGIEGTFEAGSRKLGFFYDRSNVETDVQPLSAWNNINTNYFGGYLTRELENGYRLMTLGFGEDRYQSRRNLDIGSGEYQLDENARSGYHGWQSSFYSERGFDLEGRWAGFQPYLGLQYSYIRRNAFDEADATYSALDLESASYDSLRTYLGARWETPFMEIGHVKKSGRPLGGFFQFQTAWIHEMLEKTAPICNAQLGTSTLTNSFVVEGADCGRDWVLLSVGTKWRLAEAFSFYGDYTLLLNGRETFHTGSGGLCLSW